MTDANRDDLQASMTVINRNGEKLHMAVAGRGHGWLARCAARRRKGGARCDGLGHRRLERPEEDLQASMTVINKQRERLHMAMTADGDSQDEAMAGSLATRANGR